MDVRIAAAGRRDRGRRPGRRSAHTDRASLRDGQLAVAVSEDGERAERARYWLKHSEGFQVSGPDGRIGSVALVLSSDAIVDGLVVRTGLFRTRTVFVPIDQVISIFPRRQRLELAVTPASRLVRVLHIARELSAGKAPSDAGPVITAGRETN